MTDTPSHQPDPNTAQKNTAQKNPTQRNTAQKSVDEYATRLGEEFDESARPDVSLDTLGNIPVDQNDPSAKGRSSLRFRVLRSHAKGGLGQVLVAHDNELRRQVAVKEIQSQYAHIAESQDRFIFEAEVTGRLEHPGIVPVYALGRHADGRPYYAMRFITGTAMNDAIKDLHAPENTDHFDRRLRDLLQRFVTVCNTIDFAHSRGYLHRDLKPANIMLGEYAETLVVDWGLAKQIGVADERPILKSVELPSLIGETFDEQLDLDAETDADETIVAQDTPLGSGTRPQTGSHAREGERTRAGRTVGTPQYMAPEQASGHIEQIGPHTDVYSLGATLYHLLTGHAPLADQKSMSIGTLLGRVINGEIPSVMQVKSDTPKALDAICRHAMSVDPKSRYPNARELANDVENYLADDRVTVVPENWLDRAGRWTRKHRGVTATVGASLLAVALVSTIFYAITRGALNRTERYLTISQLQQQYDTRLNEEERRLSQNGLLATDIPVGDEFVQRGDELVQQIEELQQVDQPGFVDTNRRYAMLQTWSASIEKLSGQRMNRQRHQRLISQVDRLAQKFPFRDDKHFLNEVERLRTLADRRISQWFPIDVPSLPAKNFQVEDGVMVATSAEAEETPIMDAPLGNVELSAQFGGDLSAAKAIGLTLNSTEMPGYQFLITDQEYHPVYGSDTLPTLGQSSDRGRLCAMILRGDDVLRIQPIKLSDRIERLTARRERGTLLTLVYGDEQIRFEDLFPLSTETPGKVGIVCSAGVTVGDVKLESQRVRNENSQDVRSRDNGTLVVGSGDMGDPIDVGDRAFAEGEFVDAREAYERLPENVEALAKRALVLEIVDPEEYAGALSAIVMDHSPEGVEDAADRQWYLYAGVRLFLHYLHQPDEQFRATSVLSRLKVNYTLEDVQSLIPESERQLFSQALIKPGKRTRVLFDNTGDLDSLDDAIELFSNNSQWRRLAYWRKADALRYAWKTPSEDSRRQAAEILDRLIDEMDQDSSVDDPTLVALVGDRVWVHLIDGHFADARKLLQRFLPEPGVAVTGSRLPLLIERARLLIAEADFRSDVAADKRSIDEDLVSVDANIAAAREDLRLFLDRVDPARPPAGIHYSHFGAACGIFGVLERRAGHVSQAEDVWQRGRRRNWGPYVFDPQRLVMARGAEMILETETPEPFLAAWTDGYRGNEWREIVEELLAGSGLSDMAVRNLIFNSEQLPDDWVRLVAEKTFSGPRGRLVAEQTLLHQITLTQTNAYGVTLILYQAILHLALGGESALERYPELDELLFDRCQRLLMAFQEDKFGWNEMAFILAAFTGSWNERSFTHLKETLHDEDLSAGLAMVFALMQLTQQNDAKKASDIVERHVRPDAAKLPSLYLRICDDMLREYQPGSETE